MLIDAETQPPAFGPPPRAGRVFAGRPEVSPDALVDDFATLELLAHPRR